MKVRVERIVVLVVVGLAIMLTHSSAVLAAAPCLARPLITAARCDIAPVIDGRLGDAAWKQAGSARFPARPGHLRNRIRACWDEETLYLAVSCYEPHMATMELAKESVEVLLANKETSNYYHHFVVTADNVRRAEHGTIDCNRRDYEPWPGKWQSAVHRGRDYWQLEMAIRLADLGREPSPHERRAFAFTRNRRNADASYESTSWWSPLVEEPDVKTGGLHTAYFSGIPGLLRFSHSGTVAEDGVGDLFAGLKRAKLTVFGISDAEVVIRAGSRIYQGEQTWQLGDVSNAMKVRTRQTIASGVPTSVQWAQLAGEEVVSVEVVDRASGEVVYASGQLYRRPIARDAIWKQAEVSELAQTAKRELEAVVAEIEASDVSYEQRLATWEDAKSQLRARMVARRHAGLMRNGPQENGERAYGIGIASPMTKIWPKELTMGRIDYASSISLQAARNEMEALQVVLYSPHKDLRDVKLACSDLRGESGASIGSEAVWAAPMGFLKTEQPGNYEVCYVGWWPDPILTNLDRFDVVQSDLQTVWYSVRVPTDASPGVYHGTLTISPANAPETEIPVSLEVWDFVLPESPSLNTVVNDGVISGYTHEKPSPERMGPLYDVYHRYLIDHRCNPGTSTRREPPDEKTLARWAEIGVTSFSILNIRFCDFEESSPAKIERDQIRRYVSDTLALAKKYDMEDRAYVYLCDESPSSYWPAIEEIAGGLKKEFPGLKMLSTDALGGQMRREAAQGLPFGAISGRKNVDLLVITTPNWATKS